MATRKVDPFEYVNTHYAKSLKKGSIVSVPRTDPGKPARRVLGVATKATMHVYVRVDGEKHAMPYHPNDVEQAEAVEVAIPVLVDV